MQTVHQAQSISSEGPLLWSWASVLQTVRKWPLCCI